MSGCESIWVVNEIYLFSQFMETKNVDKIEKKKKIPWTFQLHITCNEADWEPLVHKGKWPLHSRVFDFDIIIHSLLMCENQVLIQYQSF